MGKKRGLTPEEHRYQTLKKIVSQITNTEDLEEKKDQILSLVKDEIVCPMHKNPIPSVMWSLIEKTGDLISSESFIPVLQALVPLFQKFEYKKTYDNGRSVIKTLCDQIENLVQFPDQVDTMVKMFIQFERVERLDGILTLLYERVLTSDSDLSNEHYLVKFIEQALIDKGADPVASRSCCLRDLLCSSVKWESEETLIKVTGVQPDFLSAREGLLVPEDDKVLKWDADFIKVLKDLIEKGADPSWAPENSGIDQDINASSLYIFLMGIDEIIGDPDNESIFAELEELMDLLMTTKSLDTRVDIGCRTLLHVLVGKDWRISDMLRYLNTDRRQMFERIVSKLIEQETKHSMIETRNAKGHTPLHSFLFTILHAFERHDSEKLQFAFNITKILKTHTNINLQDSEGRTPLHFFWINITSLQDLEVLKFASDITTLLASSKNINLKDKNDSTVLHEFIKHLPLHCDTGAEFCKIGQSLISPTNIEIRDKDCKTALLILTEMVFEPDVLTLASEEAFRSFFSALTTEANVNATDEDLMSPYSWILLKREALEDAASDAHTFLTYVEDLLLKKGASEETARKGIRRRCGKYITHLLWTFNENRKVDEDGLTQMEKLKKEGQPECLDHGMLTKELGNTCHIWLSMKSQHQIRLFEKVFATLLGPAYAENYLNYLAHELVDIRSSYMLASVHRVLSICVGMGAVPSEEETMNLALNTDGQRSSKLHLSTLGMLIEAYRNHNQSSVFPVKLDALADMYMVGEEHLRIAMSVVKLAYPTVENCLSSNSAMNNLLLLASGSIKDTEEIASCLLKIQTLYNENWMNRSVLHLIAMYCDDRKILEAIPEVTLNEFLTAKDLHGCTPLHLAYLVNNEESVAFLCSKGADPDEKDHFGVTPRNLGLRPGVTESYGQLQTVKSNFDNGEEMTEHVDVQYQNHCEEIMTAESRVLEKMMPMLDLPSEDKNRQQDDVKRLFESMVTSLPDSLQGEVVIAGSSRERLKAGRLDEVDVQIRLDNFSSTITKVKNHFLLHDKERLHQNDFGNLLHSCLLKSLACVKWHDLPLRIISVDHPWQFIYERPGPTRYVQVSVDVVPIIRVTDDIRNAYPLFAKSEKFQRRHGQIINGAPKHQPMWFLRWGNASREHVFLPTYCEYEWDILDSLPQSLRLGVLIVKALLEISYASRGGKLANAAKPITSYMLKTVLFWLLCDEDALYRPHDVIDGYYDTVEPLQVDGDNDAEDSKQGEWHGQKRGVSFVNFSDKTPEWLNVKDVKENAEEGRKWAVKILETILHLTRRVGTNSKDYQLLPFFEIRYDTYLLNFYNKDSIANLCEILLGRLAPEVFLM